MSPDEDFPFPNHLKERGVRKEKGRGTEMFCVTFRKVPSSQGQQNERKELQWSYVCANHTEGCVQEIPISEDHFTFYLSIGFYLALFYV